MITAYLTAMRRYISFRGRASRAEFWWYTLVANVVCLAVAVVDLAFISPDSRTHLLTGIIVLAHILPSIAVAVRRLHDTDHSGLVLFINAIPIIGIIVLIVLACQAGTPGANRFGPAVVPGPASVPVPVVGRVASAAVLPTAAPRDAIAEIERLAHLRASGNLSDAEFEAMKAQALGRG